MRCTEVHLIRLLHSKENRKWGLRIEVYMRCTIFTLFKTWKLENEVHWGAPHIREPPVLIITIRLTSRSRSLPFNSTRVLSALPSSPPAAHPSDPPAAALYNRSLFGPAPFHSIQPASCPPSHPVRSAAEDRIPPGITVPYSVLHSAQGFHSAQPAPGPPPLHTIVVFSGLRWVTWGE